MVAGVQLLDDQTLGAVHGQNVFGKLARIRRRAAAAAAIVCNGWEEEQKVSLNERSQ